MSFVVGDWRGNVWTVSTVEFGYSMDCHQDPLTGDALIGGPVGGSDLSHAGPFQVWLFSNKFSVTPIDAGRVRVDRL